MRERRSSRLRLPMASAAKKTPLATRAQVPRGITRANCQAFARDVKVIEDEEKGREDELDDRDEEKVGDGFGEVELGTGRRDHALRVHNLMADFAGPGLIESADRGEHGGHAEDSAGDLLRECAAGIEGDGEEHDDEAGEENHGDHGVEGAPLDAEIFGEMSEEGAGHDWPSRFGLLGAGAWSPTLVVSP